MYIIYINLTYLLFKYMANVILNFNEAGVSDGDLQNKSKNDW